MRKTITTLALLGGIMFAGGQSAFAYEVKEGDTMGKVAEQQGMSLHTLVSLNPQVSNIDRIYIGQNLHTEATGETQEQVKPKVNTNTGTSTEVITNLNISGEDFDLLSRLVEAEAGIEPFEGKIAVANVILNRVESDDFPNTIHDVIYEAGQFQPVRNGHINKVPSEDSKEAVRKALSVNRSLGGNSLYFYDPRYSTESAKRWFNTLETTMVIGNHTFKTE